MMILTFIQQFSFDHFSFSPLFVPLSKRKEKHKEEEEEEGISFRIDGMDSIASWDFRLWKPTHKDPSTNSKYSKSNLMQEIVECVNWWFTPKNCWKLIITSWQYFLRNIRYFIFKFHIFVCSQLTELMLHIWNGWYFINNNCWQTLCFLLISCSYKYIDFYGCIYDVSKCLLVIVWLVLLK